MASQEVELHDKKSNLPPNKNPVGPTGKSFQLPVMILLLALLVAVFLFSFTIGRYAISLPELFKIFLHRFLGFSWNVSVVEETVLFNVRIPRILCAIMVGGALASSGATYQGLFKNPMVSPDILGASAGAGFGAALAILYSMDIFGIEIVAFCCGIGAVALSYVMSRVISRNTSAILILVLTGIVVTSLFNAFTSILKLEADTDNKLPQITFWLMGGLSSITKREVGMILVPFIIGVVPLFLLRWKINVMSFGEEEAKALGVNTKPIRCILIFSATLLTSSAVAVSGMIGWVGLIIPHLARLITGPDYKKLIPASLIIGAAFLLLVDDVARTLFTLEIPLGILTSIIGAPFFMYLLLCGRRGWE